MGSILSQLGSVVASIQTVSSREMGTINDMPEEARPLQLSTLKLYKEQQAVSFISNVLKQMHENNMAIINNMK